MNTKNNDQSVQQDNLGGSFTFLGTSLTVQRIGYGAMQLAGVPDEGADARTHTVNKLLPAINLVNGHRKQILVWTIESGSRIRSASARLFNFCFLMSAMGLFMGGLFTRLGNVSCPLGKVLTLVLLLVDDFFVVRYVSGIGHSRSWP